MKSSNFNEEGMDDIFAPNYSGSDGALFESTVAHWKGAVRDDWTVASNWWGGKVPDNSSEIKIYDCSTCAPVLASEVDAQRLTVVMATITTQGHVVKILEQVAIQQGTLRGNNTLHAAF